MKLILNEELSPDLRVMLEREAQSSDISLNDVANLILAEHYQVEFSPSGARYRKTVSRFKLRVPEVIHRKIRKEAAHKLQTVRGTAINIMAAHFGLATIDPRRRPRRKAA